MGAGAPEAGAPKDESFAPPPRVLNALLPSALPPPNPLPPNEDLPKLPNAEVEDVLPKPEVVFEEAAAKTLGCVAGVGAFADQGDAEPVAADAPKGDVDLGAAAPKADVDAEANDPNPELLNAESDVCC